MQIKGKNQHVIPDQAGWCVVDEANPKITQHFSEQQEAMDYAQRCAAKGEGEVLVHVSSCENTEMISTVLLPQREYLPGTGSVNHPGQAADDKTAPAVESGVSKGQDLDPTYRGVNLQAEDEYYLDL